MPPRIRTIKPDVWRDADFNDVSIESRLIFLALISNADDEGRLSGSDKMMNSIVFPTDAIPMKRFSRWLDSLEDRGMVRRYNVATRPFVDIPNFTKHQVINKPSPSTHPSWDERDSGSDPVVLPSSSLPRARVVERKGRERI